MDKKLKIAMITPHYGYINRGAEMFTKHVSDLLIKRGHAVDIYGMGHGECIRHVEGMRIDEGVGKVWKSIVSKMYLDAFFKKFIGFEVSLTHWSYFLSLSHTFKNEGYDFLWNNGEMSGALFCYKARKKYGIPFVCTFHGNESMMMITEGLLKPNIYAVLTPKYKTFLQNKIKRNIKCIPNGVDLERYNPRHKSLNKYGIDNLEHPIFLSTSALTPQKRVELIVEAISRLKRGSLVITQTGHQKKKILALAEKKLRGRFKYLGVIPIEELPSLYNSCDVYVNASRSEGHSLAILEALACNLPVVTHNDANRQWSIGGGGLLVDVTNTDKFANTLERASQIDWGNKTRKQAEKFSWDRCVDSYLKAMEEVR